MTKKPACFTLSSRTIRAIVTLFAARCAYVFGTLKVHRRLVRSISTCRTRSCWASRFIMTNFFAECTDCAQYLWAVVLIVPFWIQRALAFRTLVLRAFEAPSILVIGAAACFASWFRTMCLVVAMFLATFAHFVARSIVLHLRFFGARVDYSFRWTFARRMTSCAACSAHSVWAQTYSLAMPRLRA
jgi:hypothetical protein